VFVDDLRAAVEANPDGLQICGLEDLVEIRRLIDRIEGGWSAELVECDKRGDAQAISGLTMTNYLARECGQSRRTSRAAVMMAKRLTWAEKVGAGLRDGTVSLGKAQAFTKQLTKRTASLFLDSEADLLEAAQYLSVDDLETVMANWRRRADAELTDAETKGSEIDRAFFVSRLGDTQWILNGTLTAEQGSIVSEAINSVVQAEWEEHNEQRTLPQRRSDALTTICRNFLAVNSEIEIHGTRPHIQVHVQLDDLLEIAHNKAEGPTLLSAGGVGGVTDQGSWLDGITMQRLLCDCVLSRVFMEGSVVLEAGRPSRAIPIHLRRLVIARDRHCRYPGCDCPAAWSEVHHIIYWEHDGEHELSNLVLLCSRHHHRVHAHNETLTLHPNGQLDVTGLTGILRSSSPPPDIGHLFKRDASKRGRRSSSTDKHRGEHRIQRVLNVLQDHDSTISRIFCDRPQYPTKPLATRCNKRKSQTIDLETLTYTYEIVNGIGTLIPTLTHQIPFEHDTMTSS
jgi:Domain of unknown function (DUF222)/HNH endonuclease